MSGNRWTRREMIKAGAAAMALPSLVPAAVLGRGGVAPASQQVRVGVIGCGGRATGLIPEGRDVKGFNVVAACDLQRERAEKFVAKLTPTRSLRGPEMGHLRRLPPHDRQGEARRRDGRNHHPRPGLDRRCWPCRPAWTPTSKSPCA